MASKANVGAGTKFSFKLVTDSTYIPVAEIKTIAWSGAQASTEDVTNMDSEGAYKETIATLLDPGEISLSGNRVSGDAGQTYFNQAYGTRSKIDVRIELPKSQAQTTTGDIYAFQGYVTAPALVDLQYDKAISFSAKVKITGPVTLSAGS